MQKLIHYLGVAALSLFVTSLIGATLGASTMCAIWLTTRLIDHTERAAIQEAKEVETRRETGRDRDSQTQSPEERKTWAFYKLSEETPIVPAVEIKPTAAQYQEKNNVAY